MIVLPALLSWMLGIPWAVTFPELRGFNFVGGWSFAPEYFALLIALVTYTSAFIAEIVRSGIQAVPGDNGTPRPRSACAKASCCGRSCCRRRCASSSRR